MSCLHLFTCQCFPRSFLVNKLRSSKMKVSLQENCSLNSQNKSSTLNRPPVSQEFDNLPSFSLPRGIQYKSSTLPPPPPSRTTKVTNQSTSTTNNNNKLGPVSITSNTLTMSAGDDSCAINELLEGRMYLTVLLPPELVISKSSTQENKIVINVERRTPMMDILVNIATQYKFNASKYRISIDGYNFQASTPIGSLDVNTVSIVLKPLKPGFRSATGTNELNVPQSMPSSAVIYSISSKQRSATLSTPSIIVKSNDNHATNLNSNHSSSLNHQGLSFISNVPFKTTFRLQVNLPRNQLMVLRVSPESTIAQIKSKICDEKELDSSKYQLTAKSEREMFILDSAKCLSDYGIHEVTLMSTNHLTKVQIEQSSTHHINNDNLKNINEQSTHQMGSKFVKVGKKRAAPLPPRISNADDDAKIGTKIESAESEENNSSNNIHLRQDSGSDSSGYHESTISSESQKSSSDAVNQPKSQNKLNDKENFKQGIIKKRKAPLPPNWRDNKSEIGESIDCLSDVSVPLSSSSGSSRQSDYRIVDGRDSSNRASPPEDESSFSLVSGSSDLDIGTLKGNDSAPIPSPDSGTCSHVPLDEEKGSDGLTSAPESAIMSDSAIGDTIVEEAELEQESSNYEINKRQLMKPLSYSSTSLDHNGVDRNSYKTINKQIGKTHQIDSKTLINVNYLIDPGSSSNSTLSYEQLAPTDSSMNDSIIKESFSNINHDTSELFSECQPFKGVDPVVTTGHKSISTERDDSNVNETRSEKLLPGSTDEPNNQLNLNDMKCARSIYIKANDGISSNGFEGSKKRETSFSSSVETISMEDQEDGTSNNNKDFEKSLKSLNANQKEEPSIESTRTPTIVSEMKTIVNGGETNCDNENHNHLEEDKAKVNNEKRDNCLFGQDVKTRTKRLDQNDDFEDDIDKGGEIDEQNDSGDSVSSEFVRDLCRPRVRLTNFKIGSYKEIENLDIYQNNNAIDLKDRFKSPNTDGVKPVIVTASFKNVNSSACNEFGHDNISTISSNKISMITPQPFKLNRLASWSGTDARSFCSAYSNVSNSIEDRETIAEKAEKIGKVLRIGRHMDQLSGLQNIDNTVHGPSRDSPRASQIVGTSSSNGHRCVSQIEFNGDSSKVSIRNTVTSIKGINNVNDESPIQVTTFVKSEQLETTESKQHKEVEPNQYSKQKQLNELDTKLEIINTVKPSSKIVLTRMESINSIVNTVTTKTTDRTVPLIVSQPPPPPPMPKVIQSKININLSAHRSKSSSDQTNGKERQNLKSVPNFRKAFSCVSGSSAPKADFHDALLNEIRACGGRRALRKVNINR